MVPKFRFIDLFAGIGGIRLGFEAVGGECVFSSEWDKKACQTYEANFGEKPFGDITKISPNSIPDHDILLAGFPCQPFSIIGKKEGFENETQGTLFFNIEQILLAKRPAAFLLENVKNLKAHDGGKTFEVIMRHLKSAGYTVYTKVLNALDFGVPQKRERIIFVGFREKRPFEFPEGVGYWSFIDTILEPENTIDKKYYVRSVIRDRRNKAMKIKPKYNFVSHENISRNVTPRRYSAALRAGGSANYILINNERRPTPRELLRLQGFPDSFKIVVTYSDIKKQTGNSVCVPMIQAVAERMIEALGY